MENDNFYREQLFAMINDRFDKVEKNMETLQNDVGEIKRNIAWVYGVAAAVSLFIGFGYDYLKMKFF